MNKLKWAAGLLLILFCFGMTVSGEETGRNTGMVKFGPLELTERERDLLKLANVDDNVFFEYEVDDTIQTLILELLELKDGKWVELRTTASGMKVKEDLGQMYLNLVADRENQMFHIECHQNRINGNVGGSSGVLAGDYTKAQHARCINFRGEKLVRNEERIPVELRVFDTPYNYKLEKAIEEYYEDASLIGDYKAVMLTISFTEKTMEELKNSGELKE